MEPRFEKIHSPEENSFLFSRFEQSYFPFHWHYHPEFELVVMDNCNGKRIVGDHVGNYTNNDLVLIGPNLPHSFDTNPQSGNKKQFHSATVLHFKETFLGSGFLEKPEFRNIQHLLHEAARGVLFPQEVKRGIIPQILSLQNTSGLSRLFQFLSILDTLGQSRGRILLANEGYLAFQFRDQSNNIDKIFQYIQQNFTRDIKLGDMADYLHMSVPNFCNFFKKTTRTTFNHYLNTVRIGTACKLLIETDMTISEVCFESGYNSLSNFNRRFLSIKQTTPKEYRNSFRNR